MRYQILATDYDGTLRGRGVFSKWLRSRIKDEVLADDVATVESLKCVDPRQGRDQIRTFIERDYTSRADGPLPVPSAF